MRVYSVFFGAVGSGKSVLEAIGFVLYGDTERLKDG
jgi:DNA repair exonuclease SbcCD ATPase subunit